MDQFNKALSFILGLVVVAVFIVVASGKFNIGGIGLPKTQKTASITPTVTPSTMPKPTSKPWFSFFSKPAATPTPKQAVKPTITYKPVAYTNGSVQQQIQQSSNQNSYSGSTPTSIPNTGIPIVLFPLFGTSLLTGIFMKKTGEK